MSAPRTLAARVVRTGLGSLLTLGLASCGGQEAASGPDVAAAPRLAALPPATRVETALVERGSIATRVTAAGSVHAHRTSGIGAIVPGRIVSVEVEAGQWVEEGDLLFRIDPGPYEVALQSAEAGLALAHAELLQAREQAERSAKLAEREMVSAQEHVRARTQAAVATARVRQAKARTASARLDLERTFVRAPYAGSIVERRSHEGAVATVAPGASVVVLQESGVLIASVDIPEASLATIRFGDPARLFVEGIAAPVPGTVMSVSDRIDEASRTYAVRIPLIDPPRRAKAGSFVRAEILPRPNPDAVLVDRRALSRREGRVFALRVRDGVVEQVTLRLGVVGDEAVEVIEGLEPGDEVVVGGAVERLQNGERVAPASGGQV